MTTPTGGFPGDVSGGILQQINDALGRWRLLLWLLAAFLIAAGFDFRTPGARFDGIERAHSARMGAIEARVDSAQRDFERVLPLIETNAVIACLSIPEREAAQLRLPCRTLLESYQRPSGMVAPRGRVSR